MCVFLLVGIVAFRRLGFPAAIAAACLPPDNGLADGDPDSLTDAGADLAQRAADAQTWAAAVGPQTALWGVVAGVVLVASDLGRVWDQTYAFFGPDDSVTAELAWIIVNGTMWGSGWRVQFVSAVVALVGFVFLYRGAVKTPLVLYPAVVMLAISRPLTGHALEQGSFFSLPAILQAVHVLAAALWIGTLLVTLLIGVRSAAALGAGRAPIVAAMVTAFSPLAMGAVTALFIAGSATSFMYLGNVGALFGSTYGLVLLAKIVGFAAVGGIGCYNWQRVRPQLELQAAGSGDPAPAALLLRFAGLELALAVVVLALTAVLVALPMPMG